MKYEIMYKRLYAFAEYLNEMENKDQKKILAKFFEGYHETLKAYNQEVISKLYHKKS